MAYAERIDTDTGRTPHGVRGLKFVKNNAYVAVERSHPSRGAWIEIYMKGKNING